MIFSGLDRCPIPEEDALSVVSFLELASYGCGTKDVLALLQSYCIATAFVLQSSEIQIHFKSRKLM